jgi:hypothetical protein
MLYFKNNFSKSSTSEPKGVILFQLRIQSEHRFDDISRNIFDNKTGEMKMKNWIRVATGFVFVLVLALAIVPKAVQAKDEGPSSDIAEGDWTTGSSLDVSRLMDEKLDWLQLLSTTGVSMTKAGELCHPLRGGQFGWVGEIREYKDAHWIKIATTNGWVPNVEGSYMACAKAPEAGIYALFGYYVQPEGYVPPTNDDKDSFDCTALEWDVNFEHAGGITLRFYGTVTGLPEGTELDMTIDSSKSDPDTLGGSTLVSLAADGSYDTLLLAYAPTVNHIFVDYSVPEYGCTYSYDHGF